MKIAPIDRLFTVAAFMLAATVHISCSKKDDEGVKISGNITLSITATHHAWGVPYLPLHLKKNATEYPGTDTSRYDLHVVADNDGNATFDNLHPGNYFLMGRGFDYYWGDTVIGYMPVVISTAQVDGSTVNVELVVSE